jgi:hypothetical protein
MAKMAVFRYKQSCLKKEFSMKAIFTVAAISIVSVFAQAEVCFKAQTLVPSYVPQTICVESLEVGDSSGSAVISTEKTAASHQSLQIMSYVRHNEEKAAFEAQAVLTKPWEANCLVGDEVNALISGVVDTRENPEINPASLSLTVTYARGYDTCHNPKYENSAIYAQVK